MGCGPVKRRKRICSPEQVWAGISKDRLTGPSSRSPAWVSPGTSSCQRRDWAVSGCPAPRPPTKEASRPHGAGLRLGNLMALYLKHGRKLRATLHSGDNPLNRFGGGLQHGRLLRAAQLLRKAVKEDQKIQQSPQAGQQREPPPPLCRTVGQWLTHLSVVFGTGRWM